jgi:hypothetical protein
MASKDINLINRGSSSVVDAFGRFMVSEPTTLFDITHVYDKQPILEHELTATGASSVHLPNESSVKMIVSDTINSRIIRQSKQYCVYQPGKGLRVIMTFVLHDKMNPNLVCRAGLFDNHSDKTVDVGGDGVFLEYSNGNYYFVLRSYASGTQVETKIERSNWNGNSLNSLDFTKGNILVFDYEWLGVGAVRCGFVVGPSIYNNGYIGGQLIWAHVFDNANHKDSVYMTSANLPVRYEISNNVGGAGSGGFMKQICYTVISDGGYTPRGKSLTSRTSTLISLTTTNETFYMALRSKTAYNRLPLIIRSIDALCTTGSNLIIRVYIGESTNVAAASVTFSSVNDASGVEYIYHNSVGVVTGAVVGVGGVTVDNNFTDKTKFVLLSEKYMPNSTSIFQSPLDNTIPVGCEIDGSQDYVFITLQRLSNQTESVLLNAGWQEWY